MFIISFGLFVLGLVFGSFVNALVWRIKEQGSQKLKVSKSKAKKTKVSKLSTFDFRLSTKGNDLSILNGRSMCPNCHHILAANDLVPVLSWLELRGKCRYCSKPISWQYPLVELITACLFALSYIYWPQEFGAAGIVNFVAWCIILVGFMALIVYDIRWLMLPDRITYPLVFIAALLCFVNILLFDGGVNLLTDAVLSVVIASGLFYTLFQVSKGKWIGGGDVKLGLVIGMIIAVPLQAFLVIFVASLLGTIVAVPGLVSKKISATSHIPFGPFLIVATIIVKLFGAGMVNWYRTKFQLY